MKRTSVFNADDEGYSTATFSEDDVAGQAIVRARKKVSATFLSFSAIMREAGIDEACRELNHREKALAERDPDYKPQTFDANEIRRLYQTIVEAAQRSEYESENEKRPYTVERSFRCPAYVMELFYRHQQMPAHLAKRLSDLPPDLQKEKKRLMRCYARAWQRKYNRLHLVQCFTHLALVDKEKETITTKDKARLYKDRIADLMFRTATIAGKGKGLVVPRYSEAARTALSEFIKDESHAYAQDWSPDLPAVKGSTKKTAEQKDEPPQGLEAWNAIKAVIRQQAKEARKLVLEENLPLNLARRELYQIIEKAFDDLPEPPEEDGSEESTSSVITNGDTTSQVAAGDAFFSSSTACGSANLLRKNEDSTDLGATPVSHLNSSPEEDALRAVEAFESVGCRRFKAVFVGKYPLLGEAAKLGSEPCDKGMSMSASRFKARIPAYLKRNEEQHHNVAMRAWGPVIQVDDCSFEIMERLKPFAFYIEESSPGNYQTWLALPASFAGSDLKITEEGKRIRTRLLKKFEEAGETANGGAYGSTRLPGTLNIKEKYQPDYPRLRLIHVALGHVVTPGELDNAGLLAAASAPVLRVIVSRTRNISAHVLPYSHFVQRAPTKEDGQPNLSRADAAFVVYLLSLGWSRYEVAAELRAQRDKAARRDDYVERTLSAAEDYLATHAAPGRERIAV